MSTRTPHFSIAVFCGARDGADPKFVDSAVQVGNWIGKHGGQLVYGGGNSGLMGHVSRATRQAGGMVFGVIPQSLVDQELANTDCDELVIVETMHERKALMANKADAFLAIAGGIGTFEEWFEAWTWRQLKFHNKPVGLLNTNDYYTPMLNFLQHTVDAGFVGDWQMDLIKVSPSAPELLEQLVQEAGGRKPLFAADQV